MRPSWASCHIPSTWLPPCAHITEAEARCRLTSPEQGDARDELWPLMMQGNHKQWNPSEDPPTDNPLQSPLQRRDEPDCSDSKDYWTVWCCDKDRWRNDSLCIFTTRLCLRRLFLVMTLQAKIHLQKQVIPLVLLNRSKSKFKLQSFLMFHQSSQPTFTFVVVEM